MTTFPTPPPADPPPPPPVATRSINSEQTDACITPHSDEVPSVLKKLIKWGDYTATGSPVEPTRFVPCKTPLSRHILDNWTLPLPPTHPLTVTQLLKEQEDMGRHVGLILDLSNHQCLYTDDVPPSVRYLHIQLVAKELPQQDLVDSVQAAANAFWSECPDMYIAVHCAYGFNRTGFIMASYLIQQYGLSVDAALAAFKQARPPGVKHAYFTDELRRRYAGGEGVPLTAAALRGLGGSAADLGAEDHEETVLDLLDANGGLEMAVAAVGGPLARVGYQIEKNESLDLSVEQVEVLHVMSRNASQCPPALSGSSRLGSGSSNSPRPYIPPQLYELGSRSSNGMPSPLSCPSPLQRGSSCLRGAAAGPSELGSTAEGRAEGPQGARSPFLAGPSPGALKPGPGVERDPVMEPAPPASCSPCEDWEAVQAALISSCGREVELRGGSQGPTQQQRSTQQGPGEEQGHSQQAGTSAAPRAHEASTKPGHLDPGPLAPVPSPSPSPAPGSGSAPSPGIAPGTVPGPGPGPALSSFQRCSGRSLMAGEDGVEDGGEGRFSTVSWASENESLGVNERMVLEGMREAYQGKQAEAGSSTPPLPSADPASGRPLLQGERDKDRRVAVTDIQWPSAPEASDGR